MNNDILHRMKSIRQTIQISNAQKLVAVAHIGRARAMLEESRPYHDRVTRAIAEVMYLFPDAANRYMERGAEGADVKGPRGLLVFAASHGLAGGYNNNIAHFTDHSLKEKPAEYIICLGNACRSQLIRDGYPVDPEYNQPLDPPSMYTARELAEKIFSVIDWYRICSFDIIYSEFINAVKMITVQRRLLPLNPAFFGQAGRDKSNFNFEPNPSYVMESLVKKYLKGYLYGCLVHSYICELTSRVTAMDNAIHNGNEMLEHLKLAHNRARQAAITQEITEIVAGAAALQTE